MSHDRDESSHSSRHVGTEHYVRTLRGEQPPSVLARHVHDHLMQGCPECRRAFELLGDDGERVTAILSRLREGREPEPCAEPQPPEDPGPPVPALAENLRKCEEDLQRLRHARTEARREFRVLRDLSHEERLGILDRSVARFRSRALAEVLMEESRDRVRRAPADAASLAALVPRVLRQTLNAEGEPWVEELVIAAAALEANALRVAGDLRASDRRFAALRRDAAARGLDDPATLAEVASLEASLRIEQRRFAEAVDLLERAALLFELVGEEEGRAKVLVNVSNVLLHQGEAERAERILDSLLRSLDAAQRPALGLCAVHARIWALIELECFAEAEALVSESLDLYEASEDVQAGAKLRHLQGKIAAGLGEHAAARDLFEASCEAFLTLGLGHSAAEVCLDFALLLLDSGRTEELERLARSLVSVFKAAGVQREPLTVVILLARAAVEERVSAELVERLRGRVQERTTEG